MGTRATIKFEDDDEVYYAYRGHDGFPENVIPDIQAAIESSKNRWSGKDLGLMVTLFLARGYVPDKQRLPDYELTQCFHGDESYRYFVKWDCGDRKFVVIPNGNSDEWLKNE